ncbi:MAG: GDP-mannose 4,6-dehydratase [Candidatus Bathyarchaeia archaeon]|jgi:nucleoside-diphosphate-sugar epimerase
MNVMVTGGAGFIGRWVVKKLLDEKHEVKVFDDLSNGSLTNIVGFQDEKKFSFVKCNVLDNDRVRNLFEEMDICIHMAAQINVQDSLDYPDRSFQNNIVGTYNVLEACRAKNVKLVLIGTCMVYDVALAKPINEDNPVKPASPYAGSKLAAENLALSYYYGYGLPVVILRPFNTYGPYQKTNSEGGVVSIFVQSHLVGHDLMIYGDGEQTRDLLFVEDCADFILNGAFSDKAVGQVINAGTGKSITINDLAFLICRDRSRIKHVPHIHPQSEIRQLICDYSKAKNLLGWEPLTSLEGGIKKTMEWLTQSI